MGAPGLAALLVASILPVCALLALRQAQGDPEQRRRVAPCQPGAALRDLCHELRGRETKVRLTSLAVARHAKAEGGHYIDVFVYNLAPLSGITTHVLDTALGRPAAGVPVVLERGGGQNQWQIAGHGETDADGRLRTLMPDDTPLAPGLYRLVFDTRRYFDSLGIRGFYPTVIVIFDVPPGEAHYHVPLLLSPFGYTTYRGS